MAWEKAGQTEREKRTGMPFAVPRKNACFFAFRFIPGRRERMQAGNRKSRRNEAVDSMEEIVD